MLSVTPLQTLHRPCTRFMDLQHARRSPGAKLESFESWKRPSAQRSSVLPVTHSYSQTHTHLSMTNTITSVRQNMGCIVKYLYSLEYYILYACIACIVYSIIAEFTYIKYCRPSYYSTPVVISTPTPQLLIHISSNVCVHLHCTLINTHYTCLFMFWFLTVPWRAQ